MVCFVYLPFKKTSTISSSSIDGLGGICLPPIAGEHDRLLEHCTNRRNNPGREFGRIRGAIIWMKCVCLDFSICGLDVWHEAQQGLAITHK